MALFDLIDKAKSVFPKTSLLEGFNDFIGANVVDVLKGLPQAAIEVQQAVAKAVFPEPKTTEEAIKFGLVPIIDPKTGEFKGADIGVPFLGAKEIAKRGAIKAAKGLFKPTISRIKEEGVAGKELSKIIERATDIGEIESGKRIESLISTGLSKFTKQEKVNLFDVFEGRAKPATERVSRVFRSLKQQLDEIAEEAKQIEVQVKEKVTLKPQDPIPTGITIFQRQQLEAGKRVVATIKRPFAPRENFFPRIFPSLEELAKGPIRRDVAENIVTKGIKRNIKEAFEFIDDFRNFVESGKRQNSLIKYMVETGQATTEAEAFTNLQRFRQRTIKRQGSIEFARQADLPFFDPDPARVLPKYFASTSRRLAQIRSFGQNNETINKLIKNIRDNEGNADFVRGAVDRILEITNNQGDAAKLSTFLRTIQGFKLGLAAIPNLTQGALNTLLAGDLRAVVAGIGGLLSQEGRSFALRSGATLESVINETLRQAGGDSRLLGKFLKAVGFTVTERFNRIIAANGGRNYGNRLLRTLTKDPNNKTARNLLDEFGINVDEAIKRGKLTNNEILLVAKKFVDMTQFRSRPQDLPFFASTPAGKVFFQFKNFIYGQTRLLQRVTIQEFKNRNFGRGIRNLIILATVFPLTGEAIADVRSIVTGRKRTTKGIVRYFENIAQVGSMGIFLEALQAGKFGKGTEFLVGPTIGEVGALFDIAARKPGAKQISKEVLKRVPVVGQILGPRIFPTGGREKRPTGNQFDI